MQMPVANEPLAPVSKYLSPDQIAVLIGVHYNTVNRWLRRGVRFSDGKRHRPAALRTPGGWRVQESEIFAWLDAVKADRASAPADTIEPPHPARAKRIEAMNAACAAAGV
jgi:hypothetical protein